MQCALSRTRGEGKKPVPKTFMKKLDMNFKGSTPSNFSGIPTTRRLLHCDRDSKSSALALRCTLFDCRRAQISSRATILSLWSERAVSMPVSFRLSELVVVLTSFKAKERGLSCSSTTVFIVVVQSVKLICLKHFIEHGYIHQFWHAWVCKKLQLPAVHFWGNILRQGARTSNQETQPADYMNV